MPNKPITDERWGAWRLEAAELVPQLNALTKPLFANRPIPVVIMAHTMHLCAIAHAIDMPLNVLLSTVESHWAQLAISRALSPDLTDAITKATSPEDLMRRIVEATNKAALAQHEVDRAASARVKKEGN